MSVLGPVAIALSQAGPDCALVISVTVSISEYPSVRVYPIGTVSAPQEVALDFRFCYAFEPSLMRESAHRALRGRVQRVQRRSPLSDQCSCPFGNGNDRAMVLALTMVGMMDASTTRKRWTPRTRSRESTTALSPMPVALDWPERQLRYWATFAA